MPYVQMNTNISLNNHQKDDLLESIAKLIIILPNKKVERTMVELNDNKLMYFAGSNKGCMKVTIQLYKVSDFASRVSYTQQITDVIVEITKLDPERIYVTYEMLEDWGSGGMLKR